jgi:ABC-type Mn2+/Zn2+ transport system ATPase subunit
VRNPVCLLIDEPFRGLSSKTVAAVVALLISMANSGCAIVATAQDSTGPIRAATRLDHIRPSI